MANTELIEFLPDTCSPQSVPHTYGCIGTRDTATIPNTYGFDLPANFGTTNATDTYFHAISDLVNGITYLYPPATTNPTTPVVCTDVAAIQVFLNSINSGITYAVNAFNEIVLTFANVGDENNWEFWLGTSTPDNYTNKLTPTLHDLQVDTQTYQQVQVVKFQQADSTFIDKFFVPSGDTLVEVSLKPENTFKFGNCPDCAEWNPENVADLVECVVGSANLVTEALDVNLGAIKEVVSPGSTLTTFHTLLGNNLDIQGDGLTYFMGAGINANISGSTYIGAQFTYTFDLIADSDPGDPADFGITVWDNVAGTSVTATSITSTATYAGDAQGSGLNVPFYAWGAPGTYTIVWTGDLPVGDYTIGYMNQNFSPADHVELQVTHNLVDSMTTSKAQLVALDQCTINALTPVPSVETDLIKTNWLPLCVDGVQWYVSEKSTFDNSTSIESSVTKIYKQGANGVVTNIAPVGTNISEGYCVSSTTCGAVGDVNLIPTKLLSHTEIDTIMFNLLGVNAGKQYADLPSTAFPQTINYQGTTGNIFFGYNLNTSKYKCGTSVIANFTIMYTPLGDADPSPGDTGLDIIFLATNPSAVTLPFNSIISGTAFPPYPTQVITKLYPALPTTVQTIGASYDITGFDSINILSYVQGISAVDKVRIEGIMVEIVSGDFTDCYFVAPVKECNSSSILDAIKQQTAQVTNKIQRVHENFVVTGTTPLVIPSGAISISITKTNNTGVVNISGDNGVNFPLTFNRENFADSVNEGYSTLSAYTITGTLAGTTYKVHIIR